MHPSPAAVALSGSFSSLARRRRQQLRLWRWTLSPAAAAAAMPMAMAPPVGHHHPYTPDTNNADVSAGGSQQRRFLGSGGGARGARGHGWWVNYRAGKGGRHLQGTYSHLDDPRAMAAWNDAVLAGLGRTRAYLDVVLEASAGDADDDATGDDSATESETSPPAAPAVVHRLELELASGALPLATENFAKLLEAPTNGYRSSTLHRIEKGVGFLGGLVAKNPRPPKLPGAPRTKRYAGRCHPDHAMTATGSPTAMDVSKESLVLRHRAGVLTMLQPRIGEIDSRFLLLTHDAPHLDGVSVAIGRLVPADQQQQDNDEDEQQGEDDALETIRTWESTLITSHGVPTNATLRIVDCGLLPDGDNENDKEDKQDESEAEKEDEDGAENPTKQERQASM